MTPTPSSENGRIYAPRKPIIADIRLLRLELIPSDVCYTTLLGCQWISAQPQENLSPQRAAQDLAVAMWSPPSSVSRRFKTLQMRYPPEQFSQQHVSWRPAAELLGMPVRRLNWFWQSAVIPNYPSVEKSEPLWRLDSCESWAND